MNDFDSLCWLGHPTELYKKNGDIYLTAKAYNGRCILTWISEKVYEVSQSEEHASKDERIFMIAGAAIPDCIVPNVFGEPLM